MMPIMINLDQRAFKKFIYFLVSITCILIFYFKPDRFFEQFGAVALIIVCMGSFVGMMLNGDFFEDDEEDKKEEIKKIELVEERK